jgi:hypothetical protein
MVHTMKLAGDGFLAEDPVVVTVAAYDIHAASYACSTGLGALVGHLRWLAGNCDTRSAVMTQAAGADQTLRHFEILGAQSWASTCRMACFVKLPPQLQHP